VTERPGTMENAAKTDFIIQRLTDCTNRTSSSLRFKVIIFAFNEFDNPSSQIIQSSNVRK
jgi:hypothetical protein